MEKVGAYTDRVTVTGEWQGGDVQSGLRATPMKAEYFNMLQRELLAILAKAGVQPSLARNDQILESILKMARLSSGSYASDEGIANAYKATYTPAITELTDGMVLSFRAKNSSTGYATFSPNGLGSKRIVGASLVDLQGGEITAGSDVFLQFNKSIGDGAWILVHSAGGPMQVARAMQSHHAMQLGQTKGRFLGVQVLSSSGTYVPSPGTTKIIVEQVGGGGAGGGCVGTSSSASVGGGGGAGAYARVLITNVPPSVPVTIGAGGLGVVGGSGGAGGTTMFGSLISTAGGQGGLVTAGTVFPLTVAGAGGTSTFSTSEALLNVSQGGSGDWGIVWSLGGNALGGRGGQSGFGGGGNPSGTGVPGNSSISPGSGGAGASLNNSGYALSGGWGQPGLVVIHEYGTAFFVS